MSSTPVATPAVRVPEHVLRELDGSDLSHELELFWAELPPLKPITTAMLWATTLMLMLTVADAQEEPTK